MISGQDHDKISITSNSETMFIVFNNQENKSILLKYSKKGSREYEKCPNVFDQKLCYIHRRQKFNKKSNRGHSDLVSVLSTPESQDAKKIVMFCNVEYTLDQNIGDLFFVCDTTIADVHTDQI